MFKNCWQNGKQCTDPGQMSSSAGPDLDLYFGMSALILMENMVNKIPDQMQYSAAFDLGLHCLLRLFASILRVNTVTKIIH